MVSAADLRTISLVDAGDPLALWNFVEAASRLRDKGVQGNKPLHTLRKMYGAALADMHGLHVASSGLRHADIRTTAEYYIDRRVRVTAGFGKILSDEKQVMFPPSTEISAGS